MRISDRQLLGLLVITKSGQQIGSITGFECDTEHHTIETYLVSTSPIITRLFGLQRRTLAIARSQIISITNEAMIVQDSLTTAAIGTNITNPASVSTAPAVSTTSLE